MPSLKIDIDLDKLPDGKCVPDEAAVILREIADWIEKRPEPYAIMAMPKVLRNFESEECGMCLIL